MCVHMHAHTHIHTHTHFLQSYVEESKLCRPKWNFLSPDTISCWFLCTFSFILPPCLENRYFLWATWPNVVALQVRQLMMARAEFKSQDGASGLRRDWNWIINSQTFSRRKIRHKEIKKKWPPDLLLSYAHERQDDCRGCVRPLITHLLSVNYHCRQEEYSRVCKELTF